MAQLVVAAAGAAIGFAVGGPMGAKIGWMIGSTIGSQLDKPDPTIGPRIEDKKIGGSTYGNAIPYVWGTDRVAAQIAWSSDLIEHEEEVGGKGFGGPDGKFYTYSVNTLLQVCESPFAEPRYPLRLWGNGRLIGTFNGVSWEVDEALIQRGNLREYIGADDQMPDPVYEAAVGIENAPAYRGRLTIMLEGLQLADFGNRPPNFEVEVTSQFAVEGCPETPVLTTITVPQAGFLFSDPGGSGRFAAAYDPVRREYWTRGDYGSSPFHVWKITPGEPAKLSFSTPQMTKLGMPTRVGGIAFDPVNRYIWSVVGYSGNVTTIPRLGSVAVQISVDSLAYRYSRAQITNSIDRDDPPCCGEFPYIVCCPMILRMWNDKGSDGLYPDDSGGYGANRGAMIRIHANDGTPKGEISWGIPGSSVIQYRETRLYNGQGELWEPLPCPLCATGGLSDGFGWQRILNTGPAKMISDVQYVPPKNNWPERNYQTYTPDLYSTGVWGVTDDPENPGAVFAPYGQVGKLAYSESRDRVYAVAGDWAASIEPHSNAADVFKDPFRYLSSIHDSVGTAHYMLWAEDMDAMIVGSHNVYGIKLAVIDPDTDEIIAGPCQYELLDTRDSPLVGLHYVGQGWLVGISKYNNNKIHMLKAPGSKAWGGGVPLWKIVSDIWAQSGGDLSQIDVSELTDIVPGYTRARQLAGRGVLEPLRLAYFFDAVESGDKLKFPKSGKSEVVTIDSGELGARIFQLTQTEPAPPYELEHIEELDAPREVALSYIDAAADYDPGLQRAARQVGGSLAPAKVDLPIVLDDDYAAQVAWTTLMRLHGAKNPIKFSLSHAFEALEPSDAIVVPMHGEYRRVVLSKRTSARPLVEFEGTIEDPAVWDAIFPGVPRGQYPRQTQASELPPSLLEILDVPPLRASDDRLVLYLAMSRLYGDSWPGGVAYKSIDGASYTSIGVAPGEATTGTLTTELPAWTRGNRWDRATKVRVWLRRGTLSSATELMVLAGANTAVVGNEIIQFANATKVGDTEWELDTLLRHRLGTEWAAVAHPIGERFVLLAESSLRAVEYPLTEVGAQRWYRAVTAGQQVSEGQTSDYSALGNSVRPLSPAHVDGERAGDDLTVSWVRRARINTEWQDGYDVPLDEPSEVYRIEVLDGATVVRSETVTGQTWTYTDAEQTTDFGAPQSEVSVRICQIGTRFNIDGHFTEATL